MAGTSRLTKWQSHAVAALGVVGICRRRDGVRIRTLYDARAVVPPQEAGELQGLRADLRGS